MANALVDIPQAEWSELRELYVGQKKLASAYNTLQCLIDWKTQDDELEINIYSLNGDWRSDGTFVAIKKKPVTYVFINTLSDNQERLLTALRTLKNKEPLLVFGYPERLMPTVEQYFVDRGGKKEDFIPDGTAWYHIDREKATQFTVE
uniref:50S ribosomal protein L10 n=1 Tax=Zeugodacus cucurbitae TaxID=28588 RepID=A0A0A1WL45_ZEUCU